MSDAVITMPVGIAAPGLKIAYQVQVGEGQMIAYEAALDAAASRPELDDLFDRMGGAAQRVQAKIDLPLRRASLEQAHNSIPRLTKELMEAVAARDANFIAANRGRNREAPPRQDLVNNVSTATERLAQAKFAVESAEAYIPYLEALIRGEDAQPPTPATRTWDREDAEIVKIEPIAAAE